ncbi:MAG: polyprenyl synthetase family protein, partial [Dehalococcoidia bacterium]
MIYTAGMMDYSKHFDTIRGAVADEIQAIVGQDDLPLYDMVRYHLGFVDVDGKPGRGGGKALRPLFCCLACEAVAGDWRPALGAAAALELTHNFTLVHDDIEDGDLERRHQPTVWARWGLAQGINAGDAVWVLAWQALARAAEQGVPAATVVACSRRLAACCRELTEGQFLD